MISANAIDYIQPKCSNNRGHSFFIFHGLGINIRTCEICGLKEYHYTGATLGVVTDWRFDGWDSKIRDTE